LMMQLPDIRSGPFGKTTISRSAIELSYSSSFQTGKNYIYTTIQTQYPNTSFNPRSKRSWE
jgi:hypothetical protein